MARKKANPVQMYAEQTTGVRLSSHEKLCAFRMKQLLDNIKEMRKEVNELKETVSMGKGMVRILVFLGTLVVGAIGFFQFR